MSEPSYRLGRLEAIDERDRAFPMRAAIPRTITRKTKRWSRFAKALNQGNTGTCVGHAWKNYLLRGPVIQTSPTKDPTAIRIYQECCPIDEWSGNDNGDLQFGTSVRAGAKALKVRGYIDEYRWAQSIDDLIDWTITQGPIAIGVNWYDAFFDPSPDGFIDIPSFADVVGGHAVCIYGWNQPAGYFYVDNSWGAAYGINGTFRVPAELMQRLVFAENGEACVTSEVRLPRV